ncbi:MAG: O-antigen ligase family protein [Candidatus Latescibacterota bacterium]
MSKNPTSPLSTRLFDALFISLIIAVPLVWSSEFVFVAYYPKLLALYIGLFLLYGVWIFQSHRRNLYYTSTLTLPIIAYVSVGTLSIFVAHNRVDPMLNLAHLVAFPLFFWVVLNNYRSQNLTQYFAWAVGTGILIALLGICQYAGWGFHWIPSAGFPSATLGYRNFAAMYVILCIPICLYLFIDATQEKKQFFWGIATAILVTFLICTRTRGAWLGLSVAITIGILISLIIKTHDGQPLRKSLFATCTKQHIPPVIVGIVITSLFTFLVPPNMQGRGFESNRLDKNSIINNVASIIDHERDTRQSLQTRLAIWKNSLTMIENTPVLGVGLGNWHYQYPPYDNGESVWEGVTPKRPHNDYIWIATEQGIIGLLTYIWLLSTAFFIAYRLIRTRNRSRVGLPFFIAISIAALSTHAFFSFPKERLDVSLLFWFCLTALAILEAENRPRSHNPIWRFANILALFILISGLFLSVRALKFDTHFARAQNAVERNDWTQVVRETSAAIDYGIFDPQVFLVRGGGHMYLGNYQQAAQDNQTCLTYHPYFLNALNNMGSIYNALKDYPKAISFLQRALKINPQHADAFANLGVAYQGLLQFDNSVASFETAYQIEPKNTQIRGYLAKAYYSQGEYHLSQQDTSKTIQAYQSFLKIWPGDAQTANIVEQKLRALTK